MRISTQENDNFLVLENNSEAALSRRAVGVLFGEQHPTVKFLEMLIFDNADALGVTMPFGLDAQVVMRSVGAFAKVDYSPPLSDIDNRPRDFREAKAMIAPFIFQALAANNAVAFEPLAVTPLNETTVSIFTAPGEPIELILISKEDVPTLEVELLEFSAPMLISQAA